MESCQFVLPTLPVSLLPFIKYEYISTNIHRQVNSSVYTLTHQHTQTELPIYHKMYSRGMIKEEDENTLDEKEERGNISGESYRSLNN